MVYIIQAGKFFKIGFSTNIIKRMSGIQVGCPFPVELVLTIRGSNRDDEKYLHKIFEHKKTSAGNEWFELSKADIWSIEESYGSKVHLRKDVKIWDNDYRDEAEGLAHNTIMPIGKHKGKSIHEIFWGQMPATYENIIYESVSYFKWLIINTDFFTENYETNKIILLIIRYHPILKNRFKKEVSKLYKQERRSKTLDKSPRTYTLKLDTSKIDLDFLKRIKEQTTRKF